MSDLIERSVFDAEGLADWRMFLRALHTRYDPGSYAAGLALVAAIGAAAEEQDHHPDLDLRWGHVNVLLTSHDSGGVTARDLRLARRISEIAAAAGAVARPELVQRIEIALDTADWQRIRPFWKAVLGGSDNPRLPDEVRDLDGATPTLWFQETDEHETPRQRFHLDIRVPRDVAEARIAAGLAAGGVLVSDESAPDFVVLADADGNRVCIGTS
ncbi:VOC family protein [Nocardioides jejuensis]|uniref:Putative pterin-4-alpha-carbinolamine dehydratase n=1 Tax=Nocardioides jejuensis TaxID=2502782 RepID=A0A4R1BWB0_9ACTN|nr:VOC family protein [Nocardioides jejuensis]TCJ21827.1 4a-hydroxytetrahydrobiopterin dehydratase [Nocardioides jejuensis]